MAAEVWKTGKWHRRFEVRWSRSATDQPQVMSGGSDALDTLKSFVYDSALTELLEVTLKDIAAIEPAFWEFVRDIRFAGDFRCIPDGTVFAPDPEFARMTGQLGEVLLFRGIVNAVTGIGISVCSSARAEVGSYVARVAMFIDDGSRRTFGHGWSLWTAAALTRAGFRMAAPRLSYLTTMDGKELEIPFPTQS